MAVIFFCPSNEGLYEGDMSKSAGQRCGKCVLQQVKEQQEPEGEGSMYTLDLAVLANCMSNLLFARSLVVAKAKSQILLAGDVEFEFRPATSFPSGHVFVNKEFQPLATSKEAIKFKVAIKTPHYVLCSSAPRPRNLEEARSPWPL